MRSIKVYHFNELNEEAKRKAIDAIINAGLNWTDLDNEFLTEYFRQKLIDFGFNDVKIEWSLNYAQGDGVAFYGELNVLPVLQNNKEKFEENTFNILMDNIGNIEIRVNRNSLSNRYSHYNTMDVECINYYEESEELEKAIEELEEVVRYLVKELSVTLERDGYNSIQESSTDEYIEELAIANEFEFFEDGTLFR